MVALWQGVLAAAGGLVSAVTAAVWFMQEMLLYHPGLPGRAYEETPRDYLLPYEDAELRARDGVRLHAWLVTRSSLAATREAPTLLYFHGNAGNISHRLPDVRNMSNFVGCNVLMVSYRGYGESQGSPSERGLSMDADAALEYVLAHKDLDSTKVFAFGRSIGGAVAFSLASRHEDALRGVIVENTFLSINAMIDTVLPALRVFKFLNRNKWDNLARIGSLTLPMLFLSGREDEIVPPRHMQDLYHAASRASLRKIELFEGATHNDTWFRGGARYYGSIATFIEQVLVAQPSSASIPETSTKDKAT